MDNTVVEESKPKNELEVKQPEEKQKTSRWIGITALIIFFLFDGWDVCSTLMWVVFAAVLILTVGGTYKWGQLGLGLVLIVFGTSLFEGSDGDYGNSHYEATSSSSGDRQSDKERIAIEREIEEIESLYAQFENAYNRGAESEARRLSDLAMSKYRALQQKYPNMTREQRVRLSNLFSI